MAESESSNPPRGLPRCGTMQTKAREEKGEGIADGRHRGVREDSQLFIIRRLGRKVARFP
ncbi:hypothetical protein ALC56_14003 [Trachymyrmex septentrionalis]|uniref:Uncharacterized protein n=1 Tax=Trachymyrmex septentrionalis TaxID=34720 RepID=A0A195EVF1_9HYME|nr:hypothetical protein ALC56_14003 [Trachymyrmex septentrionalis]